MGQHVHPPSQYQYQYQYQYHVGKYEEYDGYEGYDGYEDEDDEPCCDECWWSDAGGVAGGDGEVGGVRASVRRRLGC